MNVIRPTILTQVAICYSAVENKGRLVIPFTQWGVAQRM